MPSTRHTLSALVLTAFFAMPLYALAQTDGLPQVMQQNEITYVTGGIGDDEVSALEAAKSDYNLQILNSHTDGAYVGGTHLTINDKAGTELVSSDAGPIFYAKLPVGKYTVNATRHGETKKQNVNVTKAGKATKIHFAWKPSAN